MVLKNFDDLVSLQDEIMNTKRVALVCAEDMHSLEALLDERLRDYIQPILIGDSLEIMSLLSNFQIDVNWVEIIHTETIKEAAEKGVELVRTGQVDLLMKGYLQTKDFLKPVVNKERGIVSAELLTHVVLNQVRNYPKLLVTTDGGMVTEPTFSQKKEIIKNALCVIKKLGYDKPKVALLAAGEVVNNGIKSSIESEELMIYFQKEYPDSCEIAGPISLDLALSKSISEIKEYKDPVGGDADILVGPDMTASNILGKSFVILGDGKMAGIIYGAKVPIIMTSRGSSSEEKYLSIILGSLIAGGN